MGKLRAQEAGLQSVEPLVVAPQAVRAVRVPTKVSQLTRPIGEAFVVGADRPTVAERSKVLARIEAERRRVAKAPYRVPPAGGAVGLGGVFEQQQAVVICEQPVALLAAS